MILFLLFCFKRKISEIILNINALTKKYLYVLIRTLNREKYLFLLYTMKNALGLKIIKYKTKNKTDISNNTDPITRGLFVPPQQSCIVFERKYFNIYFLI